jgi:hypothetical protein
MSPRWLVGGGFAVVVLVAAAIALLGSDDESTSGTGSTTIITPEAPQGLSADQQTQIAQLQECLREQGVEPPQPGTAQGPSPEMLQALEQCRQYVPEGLGPVP